jgi:hypothetical protein
MFECVCPSIAGLTGHSKSETTWLPEKLVSSPQMVHMIRETDILSGFGKVQTRRQPKMVIFICYVDSHDLKIRQIIPFSGLDDSNLGHFLQIVD